MEHQTQDPRIVIIGAGPAGLLTAYYLKQHGYRNVIILEKLGEVGGLCRTITYEQRSFDLGANYVTPAYTEIRRIAKRLGLTLYSEQPFVAMDPRGQHVHYQRLFDAARVDAETHKPIPLLRFMWAVLKFIWLRFWLSRIIDRPTFAGIEAHKELCVPFDQWLKANGIECLRTLFQLPVNLMGYGTVKSTPAPYPLKFMTLMTFIPMVLKEVPFVGWFVSWPRRFTYGYQRFFERLSWELDVRTNVHVKQITRTSDGVNIRYHLPRQVMTDTDLGPERVLEADRLILACPLTRDVLQQFFHEQEQLTEFERTQLSQIQTCAYSMTTLHVENLSMLDNSAELAAVFPAPPIGEIYGVAKQWASVDFVQFYCSIDAPGPISSELRRSYEPVVRAKINELISKMGGVIPSDKKQWETFNIWPYFQHLSTAAIEGGFYTALEKAQGNACTWYVGGATNFELIEPIAEYAKNLVSQHYPRRC